MQKQIEYVVSTYNFNWNLIRMHCSKQISTEYLVKHADRKLAKHYVTFTKTAFSYEKFAIGIIKKFPDLDWPWERVSEKDVSEIFDLVGDKLNMKQILKGYEVQLDFIEKHIDWNWDWKQLSKNKNAEFICSDKLIRKRISLGSIKNDMDKPCYLPYSPNLTIEFINDNLDLCWEIIMKSGKYKLASAFAKK